MALLEVGTTSLLQNWGIKNNIKNKLLKFDKVKFFI
jgi:hypothetical protein